MEIIKRYLATPRGAPAADEEALRMAGAWRDSRSADAIVASIRRERFHSTLPEGILMYRLDTNTLLYFLKGNETVVANFKACINTPKAISVIAYGELIYGFRKSECVAENLARVHRPDSNIMLITMTQLAAAMTGRARPYRRRRTYTAEGVSVFATLSTDIGSNGFCIVRPMVRCYPKPK